MTDVEREHAEGRAELAKLDSLTPEQQLSWLRGAFLSHHRAVKQLRESVDQLRMHDLANLPASHTLTLAEARLLHCCRVCRRSPPRTPLVLSFGEEFACEECLR